MEIEYTEGCVCDSLTIDGVESIDLTENQMKDAIIKMIDKVDDIAVLQSVIINIIEYIGEYSHSKEPCECCGDYVDNYKLEI